MGSIADGRAVSTVLDPILTRSGFAGGQYGEGGEEQYAAGWQTTFCAGHDALSDRYPWLPQANTQPREAGACTDLIVETTRGRFDLARMEHLSLEETLRAAGHADDAAAVSRVHGAELAEALPILAAALQRLFLTPT